MKRYILAIILGTGITGILFSYPSTRSAVLTAIFGRVDVDRGGIGIWKTARLNQSLSATDIIRTYTDSFAEIEKDRNNRFRINENTTVQIDSIEKEATEGKRIIKLTEFNLLNGSIIAKLDKLQPGEEIRIASPVAIAGARGTGFIVSYDKDICNVSVLESKVVVTSRVDPNKQVSPGRFQRVTVAHWEKYDLKATGTGILSKKFLKKKALLPSSRTTIISTGEGSNIKEAKQKAYTQLARKVLALPISEDKRVEDVIRNRPDLYEKLYRYITTARKIKRKRLVEGRSRITVELSIQPVEEIIGEKLAVQFQEIREINLGEYGRLFGPLARVTTLRAAQLDGYRKLAELIYGTVIDSSTTLDDLIAKNDTIKATVEGVVRGAEIVRVHYYSDGSISVEMQINASMVKDALIRETGDIYGKHYVSSPGPVGIAEYIEYWQG